MIKKMMTSKELTEWYLGTIAKAEEYVEENEGKEAVCKNKGGLMFMIGAMMIAINHPDIDTLSNLYMIYHGILQSNYDGDEKKMIELTAFALTEIQQCAEWYLDEGNKKHDENRA